MRVDWRKRFREGRGATLEWEWTDPDSFPVSENRRQAASSYEEVRSVIKLGESLLGRSSDAKSKSPGSHSEAFSSADTEKMIR